MSRLRRLEYLEKKIRTEDEILIELFPMRSPMIGDTMS